MGPAGCRHAAHTTEIRVGGLDAKPCITQPCSVRRHVLRAGEAILEIEGQQHRNQGVQDLPMFDFQQGKAWAAVHGPPRPGSAKIYVGGVAARPPAVPDLGAWRCRVGRGSIVVQLAWHVRPKFSGRLKRGSGAIAVMANGGLGPLTPQGAGSAHCPIPVNRRENDVP